MYTVPAKKARQCSIGAVYKRGDGTRRCEECAWVSAVSATDFDIASAHKYFASTCFNRAWDFHQQVASDAGRRASDGGVKPGPHWTVGRRKWLARELAAQVTEKDDRDSLLKTWTRIDVSCDDLA